MKKTTLSPGGKERFEATQQLGCFPRSGNKMRNSPGPSGERGGGDILRKTAKDVFDEKEKELKEIRSYWQEEYKIKVGEVANLKAALKEAVESRNTEVEELRISYENTISVQNSEISELKRSLDELMATREEILASAEKSTESKLRAKDAEVTRLRIWLEEAKKSHAQGREVLHSYQGRLRDKEIQIEELEKSNKETVKALEQELAKLKAILSELIEEKNEDNESSKRTLDSVIEEKEKQMAMIKESSENFITIKVEENERKEKDIQRLQAELTGKEAEIELLTDSVTKLQSMIVEHKDERKKLEEALRSVSESSKNEMEVVHKCQQQLLEQKGKQLISTEMMIKEKDRRIEELSAKLGFIEAQLASELSQKEDKKESNSDKPLMNELNDKQVLSGDVRAKEDKISDLQKKFGIESQEKQLLQQECNSLKQDLDNWRCAMKMIEEERNSLENEVKRVVSELESKGSICCELEYKLQSLDSVRLNLEDVIGQLRKENADCSQEQKSLEFVIRERDRENNMLKEKLIISERRFSLEMEHRAAKERNKADLIEKLEKKFEETQQENEKLKIDLDEREKDVANLSSLLEDTKQQEHKLAVELDQLSEELEILKEKYAQGNAEKEALERSLTNSVSLKQKDFDILQEQFDKSTRGWKKEVEKREQFWKEALRAKDNLLKEVKVSFDETGKCKEEEIEELKKSLQEAKWEFHSERETLEKRLKFREEEIYFLEETFEGNLREKEEKLAGLIADNKDILQKSDEREKEMEKCKAEMDKLTEILRLKGQELTESKKRTAELEVSLREKVELSENGETEIRDLTEILRRKGQELTESKEGMAELEVNLREKAKLLENAETEIRDLTEILRLKGQELTESKERMAELEVSLREKVKLLENAETEIRDQTEILRLKEQELTGSKERMAELEINLREKAELLENAETEIRELHSRVNKEEQKHAVEVKSVIQSAEEGFKERENVAERMKAIIQKNAVKYRLAVRKKEDMISGLKSTLESLEKDTADMQVNLATVIQETSENEAKLKHDLKELEDEKISLENKLSELTKCLEKRDEELKIHDDEKQRIQGSLTRERLSWKELEETYLSLKLEAEQKEQTLRQKTHKCEELERELKDLSQVKSLLQSAERGKALSDEAKRNLIHQLDMLKRDSDAKEGKIEILVQKIKMLKKNHFETAQKQEKLEENVVTLQIKLNERETEIDELEKGRAITEEEASRRLELLKDMTLKKEEVAEQLTELKEVVNSQKAELGEAKGKENELKQVVQELKESLNEKELNTRALVSNFKDSKADNERTCSEYENFKTSALTKQDHMQNELDHLHSKLDRHEELLALLKNEKESLLSELDKTREADHNTRATFEYYVVNLKGENDSLSQKISSLNEELKLRVADISELQTTLTSANVSKDFLLQEIENLKVSSSAKDASLCETHKSLEAIQKKESTLEHEVKSLEFRLNLEMSEKNNLIQNFEEVKNTTIQLKQKMDDVLLEKENMIKSLEKMMLRMKQESESLKARLIKYDAELRADKKCVAGLLEKRKEMSAQIGSLRKDKEILSVSLKDMDMLPVKLKATQESLDKTKYLLKALKEELKEKTEEKNYLSKAVRDLGSTNAELKEKLEVQTTIKEAELTLMRKQLEDKNKEFYDLKVASTAQEMGLRDALFKIKDLESSLKNETAFHQSVARRNDQLQQEINILQDRNKTDLTNLKKSLDDAIEREIFVRDKCIGNPSAHTTEKVDNKTAQKLKGLYLRVSELETQLERERSEHLSSIARAREQGRALSQEGCELNKSVNVYSVTMIQRKLSTAMWLVDANLNSFDTYAIQRCRKMNNDPFEEILYEFHFGVSFHQVGGSNRRNGNKMPEVNSTSIPSLVDFDVTHLSEEEISTLREVLEREWVLQEENAQKKRKLNQEMMQLEETISQRSHGLSGKALSEICNMCFKVKVATTGALVCERCRKKTCIRCGKRDQGVWRCALCLKIRQSLMFTGAWYHDVSPRERFQVQEMLNRLAEESVRRLEMHSDSSRGEASVRISSSPENFPLLHHSPPTYPELQVTKTLYLATSEGKKEASVHDLDIENEDDDVFEDNDEEIDKYLSFPHEEDQIQQRDGWEESYSSVHHSSLDDDSCSCESQGASEGTPEGNQSPMENMPVDDQSRRRKVGGLPISKHGDCPMIHKMTLRKDPKLQRLEMGTDYELFGIEVVGGRMCTGGFLCVYVAKVVEGSSALQCIREGDQILEWDHTSLVDVSFEKAKRIVAASPPEVTLVICHNAASFMKKPRTPSCGILTKAAEKKRKRYDSIKCWSRWSLAQLTDEDCVFDEGENQTQGQRKIGQIQLHIWHDPHGNNMTVRVLNARGLSLQLRPKQELINPYVLLYLLPNREISSHFRTNTDPETVTPKWDLSFVFSNIPESELPSRTLEVTLWSEVPGDTNIFLGESLIKMTPTLLCSGAQWFDIQDHDEASTFLPVPMRRRHTLSPRLLPPINEVRTSNEEVKNDSSPTGLKTANRSISTVNISTCVSQVFISESDGLTMQHRRRRRADSVVTMKAFRPKRNSNFQRMESFRRRFLDSSYKSRSAPATPSVSIPQSMEDLRKKRAMTRSTDGLKFPLHLSDYFTSLKSAKENAHEIEFKAKEEREGKMRGALRVMKRYPANFRIRLGKLMEKPCQLGVVAEPGASESTMSEYHDLPGYLSAPTTPNVSTSTEDLRRERSLTNYLQVPRSPGVFSIFKRRNDSQSSQVCAGNVAEGEEPSSMETQPCFSPRLSPSSNDVGWEVFSPLPTMKETEPHFTFPKPIHDPQFDYVDEEEVTPEERPSRDAYAGDTEAGELGIGNQQLVALPESSPLDNDDQEPCLNVMDKWEIPRITVHRDSTGDHTLPASADNAPKQEAEPPAGKKGTLHALRKYSRSLRPRLSRDSAAKLTLYGEDPVKGVVGPGQLRRGSYQGHELGYLRIGLFSSRGSLEVEIIRGVSLLVLGDHPPDTYVKTYLIKDQVRLLKRKTSITRQSVNPVYNCKIKYSGCEVHNSELLVSVWCKQGIFGRKVLLGEVHIALGSLNLSVKQVAWYKLFIESQLSDD